MKKALTIAGSDSCAGAGIQADLKTFAAHGIYGMSVITAVTAQNTQDVLAVQDISSEVIARQIKAIFEDIEVDAVKIGMVSQTETIITIAEKVKEYQAPNIVLDPVMVSKSGCCLLHPAAKEALAKTLFPLALIITPNIPEAEVITDLPVKTLKDMERAARFIYDMGPQNVLVKGGHLPEEPVDILFDGKRFKYFTGRKIQTKNTHGTGCTLSSAIAANLALGYSVEDSISSAKEYVTTAIEHSLPIGKGAGPTNHFYTLYKKAGLLDF
jgi:hydroxymethylpyrimidine/phosphomethylpyrimidine kinase